MKVYAARYSACTYDSAMAVVSMHATLEGAQAAMEQHRAAKKAEYMEFLERHPNYGGPSWSDEYGNGFEGWDVTEYEVMP